MRMNDNELPTTPSVALAGLVIGVQSIRDRILARIDAQPDGITMTKLLFNLPLPPGDGRYEELRAMLAEGVIVGEKRSLGKAGRPPIYFRRATSAASAPQPPTPGAPRPW